VAVGAVVAQLQAAHTLDTGVPVPALPPVARTLDTAVLELAPVLVAHTLDTGVLGLVLPPLAVQTLDIAVLGLVPLHWLLLPPEDLLCARPCHCHSCDDYVE